MVRLISRVREMKNQNQIVKQTQESNSIYQERLRQARATFNLTLNLLKLSVIASFASILLIYSGNVPSEKVETTLRVINGIVSLTLKFTKDANNRLDDDNKD
ncbi:TRADD-N-associated membrane domain-containing protein [Calothrix sp. CCY 0018]|uniref:TRADD-N-associated membrane domain-containing protein n=1 Tax=Calothrix sp. CCY 0018 TaxID=3103864 RepID=UPI0039C6FA59